MRNKLHSNMATGKYNMNKKSLESSKRLAHFAGGISAMLALSSCVAPTPRNLTIPSVDYASRLKRDYAASNRDYRASLGNPAGSEVSLGSVGNVAPVVRYASDQVARDNAAAQQTRPGYVSNVVTNLEAPSASANDPAFADPAHGQNQGYTVQESNRPNIRDYSGPLSLGEPGVSSSLWRETRSLNLIRDVRAFLPMDLITIVVQETAEGKREADTDIKQDSSIGASINSLLGIDDSIIKANPQVLSGDNTTLKNIIDTEFNSSFKGEGETTRKGSLKGKISAMVVEVLPSGVLRVEGEKILSVNNEDEVMVISGLIRPEDVTSSNEVSSGKLANMRIDYYGQGTVGDAQVGGWMGRMLRRLWPF